MDQLLLQQAAGSITATIPVNQAGGTGYRIRIIIAIQLSTVQITEPFPINARPSITTTGAIAAVCFNAGDQTTSLAYSATTGSPTAYSIDWDATANTAGLADQGTTAFAFTAGAGSVNNIDITAGTPGGTYSGTLLMINANGCSNTQAVTVTVSPTPTTADAGSPQTICSSGSATLAANIPTVGTGLWSIQSGPSTSLSQITGGLSNPVATFTPAGGNGLYTLRWTISSDPCTPSFSRSENNRQHGCNS